MKHREHAGKRWLYPVFCILLFTTTVLSLLFGSSVFSPEQLWGGITGQSGFETIQFILFSLRLSRVLAAWIAGTGLSVA